MRCSRVSCLDAWPSQQRQRLWQKLTYTACLPPWCVCVVGSRRWKYGPIAWLHTAQLHLSFYIQVPSEYRAFKDWNVKGNWRRKEIKFCYSGDSLKPRHEHGGDRQLHFFCSWHFLWQESLRDRGARKFRTNRKSSWHSHRGRVGHGGRSSERCEESRIVAGWGVLIRQTRDATPLS